MSEVEDEVLFQFQTDWLYYKRSAFDGELVGIVCDKEGIDLKGKYNKDVYTTLVELFVVPELKVFHDNVTIYEVSSSGTQCRLETVDDWHYQDVQPAPRLSPEFVSITRKMLVTAIDTTKSERC